MWELHPFRVADIYHAIDLIRIEDLQKALRAEYDLLRSAAVKTGNVVPFDDSRVVNSDGYSVCEGCQNPVWIRVSRCSVIFFTESPNGVCDGEESVLPPAETEG